MDEIKLNLLHNMLLRQNDKSCLAIDQICKQQLQLQKKKFPQWENKIWGIKIKMQSYKAQTFGDSKRGRMLLFYL
jgi:hypothetical protein